MAKAIVYCVDYLYNIIRKFCVSLSSKKNRGREREREREEEKGVGVLESIDTNTNHISIEKIRTQSIKETNFKHKQYKMIDSIPFGSDLAHEREEREIRDHTHIIVFNENSRVLVEKRGHSFSINGKLGFPSEFNSTPEELCLKQMDAEIDNTETTLYSQRFTSAQGKNLIRHRYYLVHTTRSETAYQGQHLMWKSQEELRDSLTHFLELDKSVVSLLLDTWHEHDHHKKRRRRRRGRKETTPKRKRRAERVRKIGATFLSRLTEVERRGRRRKGN